MQNQWAKPDSEIGDAFDQLVYQSRLIGADTSLVVWGGGNTSIKSTVEDCGELIVISESIEYHR